MANAAVESAAIGVAAAVRSRTLLTVTVYMAPGAWGAVRRVTLRFAASSVALKTVSPPLREKLPTVAAESATGLLNVTTTLVQPAWPTARAMPGAFVLPSGLKSSVMRWNQFVPIFA